MKVITHIFIASIAFCLICSSCSIKTEESSISKLEDSYSISKSSEPETESTAIPIADNTSEVVSDGIKWNLDEIQKLNDVSKVSIYRVDGELDDPAITDEYPEGYTDWNENVNRLYDRGFYADITISRDLYAYTANSQRFIDISTLPEEIKGYAKEYDLLDYVESEEYQQSQELEYLLREWDIPTENIQYPIQHISIRQQVDGIPTMPLRGNVNSGNQLSYYDIEGGKTWTNPDLLVGFFNGEYAIDYLIISGLEIKEPVEKDLDVIPFDKIKANLKGKIGNSIITFSLYSNEENKVKDCTVNAAEVCYVMLSDNYAEPRKSTKCYLLPFWVVYYKCGLESGLTQQGAAFFPAVEGVKYV